MCNLKHLILVVIFISTAVGCAAKKVAYVTTGSVLGAGGGYAIDRDKKDAAIGGLIGGFTGSVLADVQQNKENRKYKEGFDQGYTQAQLEAAMKNWDENTGKRKEDLYSKSYERIKIPPKVVNDISYESHYETLEVYK